MALSRDQVITAIRRATTENGGKPPGVQRFRALTGIQENNWLGRYWARWGDALTEAGLERNKMQTAYSKEFLLERYVKLVRELGHAPVKAELAIKAKQDPTFPNYNTFRKQLGERATLARAVAAYAEEKGLADVAALYAGRNQSVPAETLQPKVSAPADTGWVYLLKAGRYHKVGRSNAVGRRERELDIQLPEATAIVHSIRTDDPVGIEQYWHKRFENKRAKGEWFLLTPTDVAAFKKRRFM